MCNFHRNIFLHQLSSVGERLHGFLQSLSGFNLDQALFLMDPIKLKFINLPVFFFFFTATYLEFVIFLLFKGHHLWTLLSGW